MKRKAFLLLSFAQKSAEPSDGKCFSTECFRLAVVAENDIILATDIGSPATIEGTFATAGTFFAQPNVKTLNFVGGFDAQVGANLSAGWPTRLYTYEQPPRGMLLPYFISVESYNVVKGKFSQ